jgi:hypothetical protein
MSVVSRAGFFALMLSLISQALAFAEPMDLSDPQPRWVSIRFEVSPAQRPDQLDTIYTQEFPAWFAPDDVEGQVRVTVDGRIVEQYLLAEHHPVEGSFSDYIWVFDASSGHVLSATVVGRLIKTLDWGFFRSEVETSIRVQMATRSETGAPTTAGFAPPRSRFGQLLFHFCTITEGEGCTLVSAAPYDPRSGYVNAVGPILARGTGFTTRAFSPLGEARFSEISTAPAVSAAPPVARGALFEQSTLSPAGIIVAPRSSPGEG